MKCVIGVKFILNIVALVGQLIISIQSNANSDLFRFKPVIGIYDYFPSMVGEVFYSSCILIFINAT